MRLTAMPHESLSLGRVMPTIELYALKSVRVRVMRLAGFWIVTPNA